MDMRHCLAILAILVGCGDDEPTFTTRNDRGQRYRSERRRCGVLHPIAGSGVLYGLRGSQESPRHLRQGVRRNARPERSSLAPGKRRVRLCNLELEGLHRRLLRLPAATARRKHTPRLHVLSGPGADLQLTDAEGPQKEAWGRISVSPARGMGTRGMGTDLGFSVLASSAWGAEGRGRISVSRFRPLWPGARCERGPRPGNGDGSRFLGFGLFGQGRDANEDRTVLRS
ncbi:MAG: hypothetical protein RLZZ450_6858 [Pseudomonadota bacterium]|jgi:hypothetical protein